MKTSLLVGICALELLATGCRRTAAPGSQADTSPAPAPTAPSTDAGPVNATPIPTASVAALVNPQSLPSYAGPTGSIEGTIRIVGPEAPTTTKDYRLCPDGARTYGRAFREGRPEGPDGARWLADAVVAVTGYSGFYVPESAEAKLVEIEGCAFGKRTITMTYGQRLDVKNLTPDFWTPKLEPGPSSVMMMAPPRGDAVHVYPKKPGRYALVDHDRKYATADLYVFLHPLHTTSAPGGAYRIDGVPVGKVKVNTMHPQVLANDATSDVEIREGVVTKVDLTLVQQAPAVVSDAAAPEERRVR